jgi:hypothetical protein
MRSGKHWVSKPSMHESVMEVYHKVCDSRVYQQVKRLCEKENAPNGIKRNAAFVLSHYGTKAALRNTALPSDIVLSGPPLHLAWQATRTSSRLGAFESTKIGLRLALPRGMIGIGRSI